MSNFTSIASLSTEQKVAVGFLIPAAVIVLFLIFRVCNKGMRLGIACLGALCTLLCIILVACIIAVVVIFENPAALTYFESYI